MQCYDIEMGSKNRQLAEISFGIKVVLTYDLTFQPRGHSDQVYNHINFDLCLQAVAAEFQNESAAALAAAATRHLQEAEQAKNSGNEHWWGDTYLHFDFQSFFF